jgi:hypothetical protein
MEMTDFCSFACKQAQSSLRGTAASTDFVAAVVCMRQGPATLCSLNTSAGLPDSQLPAGRSDCRNFYHRSQLCGLQQLPHGHSGRLRGWRCCLAHLICHIPTVRSAYHITRLSGGFHVVFVCSFCCCSVCTHQRLPVIPHHAATAVMCNT